VFSSFLLFQGLEKEGKRKEREKSDGKYVNFDLIVRKSIVNLFSKR
jgi:hypothetical protein